MLCSQLCLYVCLEAPASWIVILFYAVAKSKISESTIKIQQSLLEVLSLGDLWSRNVISV